MVLRLITGSGLGVIYVVPGEAITTFINFHSVRLYFHTFLTLFANHSRAVPPLWKVICLLGLLIFLVFIQPPYWLIYYSWRPNRPRKTWSLRRTINIQILRKATQLPLKFVWVPKLGEEDIVGMVAEHAARAGTKPIAIPAYWILREGIKWSLEYEKGREDEQMMLYFHSGAFIVRSFPPSYPAFVPTLVSDEDCPNSVLSQRDTRTLCISPECCRSTTCSALGLLLNGGTRSRLRS